MNMEAPEKIYIFEEDLQREGNIVMYGINQDKDIKGLVEYTHTDAFIEKACEYWYKYNRDVVNKQCCGFTVNVEDFRKYMKGE